MKSVSILLTILTFAALSIILHADPEHVTPESAVEVLPVIKKFEYPIDDDLKGKLLAMTKRYSCTLKKLLQNYGVKFSDGSAISMNEAQNMISGVTDHQNGFYIMLVLAQISRTEISELIRPESDDCGFSPPSTK